MINVELNEEMEMPCPCKRCGKWFDLNDGFGSEKWYRNEVICESCHNEERQEIDRDEEIEDLISQIDDAEFTIKECRRRLIGLGVNVPVKVNTPNY